MKICGIYTIQSLCKPDRIYIGSSIDVEGRWKSHINELKLNKHHSAKLQYHVNKYGNKDLVFIITELCLPSFLTAREQYYINKLKPYFNICKIAGNLLGYKHTEETKQKISKTTKGVSKPIGFGNKISISNAKRKFSDKTKQKIGISKIGNDYWVGRHHSENSKAKMSLSKKGKPSSRKGAVLSLETRKRISESRIEKFKRIA